MAGRLVVLLGVLLIVASAVVEAGPAQDVLRDLAESQHADRILSGAVSIGVGVAIGVASAAFLMGTDLGVYGLIAGAIVAIPGVVQLLVPSVAELEYAQAGNSEVAAALALQRLADTGKRNRILAGIGNAAAAVAELVYPINLVTPYDSLVSAVTSAGMAVYNFLVPSPEEAAYERYLALAGIGTPSVSPSPAQS